MPALVMQSWSLPSPTYPPVPQKGTLEQRRHPRFPAVEDRTRLRWEDGTTTIEQAAFLVDISRGGARLTSETFIPDTTSLNIFLGGVDDLGAEILGRVVRIGDCAGVGYLIHVEFLLPCPDTLLERAVGGLDGVSSVEDPSSGSAIPGNHPWPGRGKTHAIGGKTPRSASSELVRLPTIPRRIADALSVLRGQYGDIIAIAKDREQSRQSR